MSVFDRVSKNAKPPAPTEPRKFASEETRELPDGDYEIELFRGSMNEETGLFRFSGKIVSGAQENKRVEKAIFLQKKDAESLSEEENLAYGEKQFQSILRDLGVLGFDVEHWDADAGRPPVEQMKLACAAMRGMRVRVRKKTSDSGYPNIYLNKRLNDGKPLKLGADEMRVAAEGTGESPIDTSPDAPATGTPTPGTPW